MAWQQACVGGTMDEMSQKAKEHTIWIDRGGGAPVSPSTDDDAG